LEPIGADYAGYACLEKVVRSLALTTGGIWVGPNEEVYAQHMQREFAIALGIADENIGHGNYRPGFDN